jgi:hypothetical protein
MKAFEYFVFSDAPVLDAEAFVVRIPEGVKSVDELFDVLYTEAQLPDYFGFNWNALSDCLRDLHWVKASKVIILHGDLMELPEMQLDIYVTLLSDCITSWAPNDEHSLTVIFPSAVRNEFAKMK